MSFRKLITALTFLAIFTMAVRVSTDTDTWWHLRAGQLIVERGEILREDPFSLTRQGQPWVYPGWISQIMMFAIHQGFGLAGLNVWTGLMVTIAFAFIWFASPERPLLKAFILILAAAVSGVYWSARPQILSFALTGLFIWALETRRLWLLPIAMAVWANLHGGFAIGLILIAVKLLGDGLKLLGKLRIAIQEKREEWRNWVRLAGTGAVSAAAVSLNPHGPAMLLYPLKTVSIGVLQDYIQEWQSPDFHAIEVQPFLWMLLLTAGALAISRKRKHPSEIMLVGLFMSLGLLAARNIALYALVAAPILARHTAAILNSVKLPQMESTQLPTRITRWVNLGLLGLLVFLAAFKVAIPLNPAVIKDALKDSLPLDAVEHLSTISNPDPLFNSYNWGGLIIWELYPDYLTFVDGRTDLFDDEILGDYLAIWRADPGWEVLLERWNIGIVFVEQRAPIADKLISLQWQELYRDDQAIILGDSD
jgi:hypothetical protein